MLTSNCQIAVSTHTFIHSSTNRSSISKGKDGRRVRDCVSVIDDLGLENARLRVVLKSLEDLDAATRIP